ncbi:hypothetical protein SYNPS1DRAFT_13311, partial [Syncephalis pseudoplumigaleata]
GRPLACGHTFCNGCLGKAVWSKVIEKEQCFPVRCPQPKCPQEISDDVAERTLKHDEFKQWCFKRAIHAVAYKVIYCPVRHCSQVVEMDERLLRGKADAECPYCHTIICVRCRKLPESERSPEDLQTLRLASAQRWIRCPDCRAFVERTMGCPHMHCRCGSHL